MIIKVSEILDRENLIGHIVLQGIADSVPDIERVRKQGHCVVTLLIDGEEVDLNDFVQHWQSQVKRMIAEEAENLVSEEFNECYDILDDLKGRIKTEVDKRLEDWERDINNEH